MTDRGEHRPSNLCRCCGEPTAHGRSNCPWCLRECTNEGCVKPSGHNFRLSDFGSTIGTDEP